MAARFVVARAGLLLAALVLLKEEYVLVAAVVIGWYGLRYWRRGGLPPALALRYAVLLILPTVLAVVANVAYNLLANGDALNPGYTTSAFVAPVLSAEMTGIYGMLASPGKSLFLYSPPLLLLPFALPRFAASHRWLVGLGAAIATLLLLFYARLSFWSGDLAWGPRYIMPLTPLLVLPLGALLPSFANWQGWRRGGVVLLLVGGVAVQLLSALVSFQAAFFAGLPNGGDIANHYSETQFLPWQSPLVQMSAMLTHGQITASAVSHLSGYGLPVAADYLVPVLLVIVAASTGTRL